MELNDISHLDHVSPFDAIDALDAAIAIAREAFAQQIARTPITDATKSDAESYMVGALDRLWGAREHLVASVEAEEEP